MGKPTRGDALVLYDEHIVVERELGELKHLSSPRKRNDSLSSGERKGKSPNQQLYVVGVVGLVKGTRLVVESSGKGNHRG